MARSKQAYLVVPIIFVTFVCVFVGNLAKAYPSSWLDITNPTLVKEKELAPNDPLPETVTGLGNRDCQTKTVTTRPVMLPSQLTALKTSACFVKTAIGYMESNGLIQFNGAGLAGQSTNYTNIYPGIIAIPNSPDVFHYSSGGSNGLALRISRNAVSKLGITVQTNGEIKYQFLQSPEAAIRDRAGNLLAAQTNSLSFSENGDWLVVDSPFKAMLRVNVKTLEALPFTAPFNYNIGVDPGGQTAISNDGRYAIVASKSFTTFKIFDLDTCGAVPNVISVSVTCQSRNLWPFMQSQVPNFTGVSNIRFTSNDVIELYAGTNTAGVNRATKFSLIAPGKVQTKMEYLALGDSFASGEGAYNYKDGTDETPNKCHLSQFSYPYLIKEQLNFNSAESVACSGAKIGDVVSTSKDYIGQTKDKERSARSDDELEIIQSLYLPGYIPQYEFLDANRPDRVTISTVGNDIGFGDKIKRCVEPDTCYTSYEDRLEIVREVNSKFDDLTDMFKKIQDRAATDAKIYVVGYPKLAVSNGNCAPNVHLSSQEIVFSNLLIDHLNFVIKKAADNVGASYVDVTDAFTSYRLCETNPYNTAAHGFVLGYDAPINGIGPVGKESYHPSALGHRLLKEKILTETQNFTKTMPSPNPASVMPPEDDSMPFLDAPHSGRQIYSVNYDEDLTTSNTVVRGGVWGVVVKGAEIAMKPLSAVKAILKSDPVDLGSFTTDMSGNLSAQITIPADTSPGHHTLHIQGLNMANEPIDIYKVVYVAASETDFD